MSLQDSTFKTAHVLDNEIIKASDIEFAFEQLVENVSKATQMFLESSQDFVINGKVIPDTGMNVKVSPIYGVCKSTGKPFGRTETTDETIGFSGSSSGRIDIIEVQGAWETYDNQQRAFNDPDTDIQTYQYVDTKKLMKPVYRIVEGVEGASVAPEVEAGWVKLAEVSIRAGATSILATDIHNITADIAGLDNDDWTTEKDVTFNIGYISDINARFRVQHEEDGTHSENSINAFSLDIGTGTNQINGNILPVGGAVSIPTQTIASTDSILSVVTKVATMITTIYNAYLKYGTWCFNGELKLSSLLDNGALKKPISISAPGDGTAVIKIDNNAVISIDSNGKPSIVTTGYTPTASTNIVTKAITDAISNSLSNLSSKVDTLETMIEKQSETDILSTGTDGKFNVSNIAIRVATTGNITLAGPDTSSIDGVTLTLGDYILVKDQTDAKENGIYQYVNNAAWSRVTDFNTPAKLKGKIHSIASGTLNKGKMFYLLNEIFKDDESFGEDNINFAEYFGSINSLANRLIMRDENGRAKVAAPSACDDIARKAEIDALYGNITGCALAVSGAVGTATTFARSDHVHPIPNSIIDYNDAANQIGIGWRGDSLTCCEICALTAYGAVGGKVVLKDVAASDFKCYLGRVCAAERVYRLGYTNGTNFNFDVALVNGITCCDATLYTSAKCRLWFGHASGELSIVDGGCAVTGIVRACCFTGQAEKAHYLYYCSAGAYLCFGGIGSLHWGIICNPLNTPILLTPFASLMKDLFDMNDSCFDRYFNYYKNTIIDKNTCFCFPTSNAHSGCVNLQTFLVY